jgi:hypothetical protein
MTTCSVPDPSRRSLALGPRDRRCRESLHRQPAADDHRHEALVSDDMDHVSASMPGEQWHRHHAEADKHERQAKQREYDAEDGRHTVFRRLARQPAA